MKEFNLTNPCRGVDKAKISPAAGGAFLYVKLPWQGELKCVDGYRFSSVSSAKRYYATNYQSKKYGYETPIWEEITFNVGK
ncbi:hypothetical protein [Chryseobacterium gallinarum]|uniref:Uncharacterized protein n=1 Tax=Chryseobacterium gallinarum TaxID=1324352 RepID=A0ABX6KUF4_CHRGL|nr:hypothetical protein [Chryseobacterium gallinarum]QIY92220.1 hypothetical protein FOB44_16810 [Chryseobacterium gallinarum]